MVTRSRMYQKNVTIDVLYLLIAFVLLKCILSVIFMSLYIDALGFSNYSLIFQSLYHIYIYFSL